MKKIYLAIATLALLAATPSQAAKPAAKAAPAPAVSGEAPINTKAVLDQVEKNASADDEVATLQMTILESNGAKREKKMELRRKGKNNNQSVLVRMLSPADDKGITLLSKSKGSDSDVWYFAPSSKQVRRIVSGKKGGSFLGSELSYEDMEASSDSKTVSKALGRKQEGGREHVLIENTIGGDSSYSKTILWVDDALKLLSKVEYFDKAGKPLKVTTFSGYKKYGSTWRAQKIEVTNLQNKRGTTLALLDVKVNTGLKDGEFTESALTEAD